MKSTETTPQSSGWTIKDQLWKTQMEAEDLLGTFPKMSEIKSLN